MTLSAFVAFCLGMCAEVIWLWEGAHPAMTAQQRRFSPSRWLLGPLTVLAALLIALFEVLGVGGTDTSMSNSWVGFIFVGVGLFVLLSGVVGNNLLPRVNEASILVTLTLVMMGIDEQNWWLAAAVLAPSLLVVVYLFVRSTPPPALIKAFIYFWYLLALIVLSFENGTATYFSARGLSIPEAAMFGSVFIFLLLHGLFSVRFFLIVSSLILPRNRRWVGVLMPKLFDDGQAPRLRFVLLFAAVLAVVLLNDWLDLAPRSLVIGAAVLASTQVLFRTGAESFSPTNQP